MIFAKGPKAGVAPHKKQQDAFFQLPTDIFCHAAPPQGYDDFGDLWNRNWFGRAFATSGSLKGATAYDAASL
jgi:hypothetical protein